MKVKLSGIELDLPLESLVDPLSQAVGDKLNMNAMPHYTHSLHRVNVSSFEDLFLPPNNLANSLSYICGLFNIGSYIHFNDTRENPLSDISYPSIIGVHIVFKRPLTIPEFIQSPESIYVDNLTSHETALGKGLVIDCNKDFFPGILEDKEKTNYAGASLGIYSADKSKPFEIQKILRYGK